MESLMKFIARTARCSNLFFNKRFEDLGLSGFQYPYILNICYHPGISQDQLAKRIYIDKSNVARQLAILEDNGFIRRSPLEADRRQMQVYPTDKSIEIFPLIKEEILGWNQLLMEDLTTEEQLVLLGMMEKVMHRATEQITNPKVDK